MGQIKLFDDGTLPSYLLSIQESSANAILTNNKSYEFRRRFTEYIGDIQIFLYVGGSKQVVPGKIICGPFIKKTPTDLCNLIKQGEFDISETVLNYLQGIDIAYALPIKERKRFSVPIQLNTIKQILPFFTPPMSYLRLDNPKYIKLRDYLMDYKSE